LFKIISSLDASAIKTQATILRALDNRRHKVVAEKLGGSPESFSRSYSDHVEFMSSFLSACGLTVYPDDSDPPTYQEVKALEVLAGKYLENKNK
jgi:hypothetical protein